MLKYFKGKLSGKMKFDKKILFFSFAYILLSICIIILQSFLPMSKIESCSNGIANLASKSNTNSALVYFKPKELFDVDSFESIIENFNRINDSDSSTTTYKQFVGTNFDKKTISIPKLEDNNPVILMSTRLSQYSLDDPNEKFYYSGIKLLGLSPEKNIDSNFCYITTKQADYIISQSDGVYHSYADLINETLDFNISTFNGNVMLSYHIQDIIISDEGNDKRYNEIFGSYIYCYYLSFQKNTGISFAYDLGNDNNQNSEILSECIKKYPSNKYSFSFCHEIDTNVQSKVINNFEDILNNSNLTVWFLILEFSLILIFVFTTFSFIEKDKSYSILLLFTIFGLFFIGYNILLLLSLLKVNFVSAVFNPFTNLIEFSLAFLIICSILIAISGKKKENTFLRDKK